ncbi:MAG TPA: hypothetical protein VIY08_00050 [Candidatus Nitrosocosmicus sp.]
MISTSIVMMAIMAIIVSLGMASYASNHVFAESTMNRFNDGYNYGNLDGNTLKGNMKIINGPEFLKHTTAWQNGFVFATDNFFKVKLPFYDYENHTSMNIPGWISGIVYKKQ